MTTVAVDGWDNGSAALRAYPAYGKPRNLRSVVLPYPSTCEGARSRSTVVGCPTIPAGRSERMRRNARERRLDALEQRFIPAGAGTLGRTDDLILLFRFIAAGAGNACEQSTTGAGMVGDAQRARRKLQSQRLVRLPPCRPFVLKARDGLAEIMQADQTGNPARHMLTGHTKYLSSPVETAWWLMLDDAFGHSRHIQQMRQYAVP